MARTPSLRWNAVCLDCKDAEELAAFYGRLLGWEVTDRDGAGWVALRDPAGGVGLLFQAEEWYEPPVWPERPEVQHKMLHFEIQVDDVAAAVDHAVAARPRRPPVLPLERLRPNGSAVRSRHSPRNGR